MIQPLHHHHASLSWVFQLNLLIIIEELPRSKIEKKGSFLLMLTFCKKFSKESYINQ